MNTKKLLIGLTLGLSILTTSLLAEDVNSIMKKVDARDDGKTLEQNMKMTLIDKSGKKRVRSLKTYSKDFGADTHQIMFFKSPADVKNTSFLTYDYDSASKDDDQWLYLPALKKVKRIPSSDKSSSFMGSDFSYFDMTKRDLKDYKFKILKEGKVRGKKVWIIESLPRSSKIVKESGYKKTIAFVRQDNYVVVRSIGFMRNGKKKYLDVSGLRKTGGVWLASSMTMTTKKGRSTIHKTLLRFSGTKLNRNISNSMFTTRRLEKGL